MRINHTIPSRQSHARTNKNQTSSSSASFDLQLSLSHTAHGFSARHTMTAIQIGRLQINDDTKSIAAKQRRHKFGNERVCVYIYKRSLLPLLSGTVVLLLLSVSSIRELRVHVCMCARDRTGPNMFVDVRLVTRGGYHGMETNDETAAIRSTHLLAARSPPPPRTLDPWLESFSPRLTHGRI